MTEQNGNWVAALVCQFCGKRWTETVKCGMVPTRPNRANAQYISKKVKIGLYFINPDSSVITPAFNGVMVCPNCGNYAGVAIETPPEPIQVEGEATITQNNLEIVK